MTTHIVHEPQVAHPVDIASRIERRQARVGAGSEADMRDEKCLRLGEWTPPEREIVGGESTARRVGGGGQGRGGGGGGGGGRSNRIRVRRIGGRHPNGP